MNNEKKYRQFKNKKLYKYLIIFFSLLTIFLEGLALFQTISFLWGFIPFFLTYYFKGLYEEIRIKDLLKRKKSKQETNSNKKSKAKKKIAKNNN